MYAYTNDSAGSTMKYHEVKMYEGLFSVLSFCVH